MRSVVLLSLLVGCNEFKISSSQPDPGEVGLDTDGLPIAGSAPVARCRFDPVALEIPGTTTLVGRDSQDPAGLSLTAQWTWVSQPAGSSLALPGSDALDRGPLSPQVPGTYEAQLVVTNIDGVSSEPCVATLEVTPPPPVAMCDADPRQALAFVEPVTLIGRDSFDPLGGRLSSDWRVVRSPPNTSVQIPFGIFELDRSPVLLPGEGSYTFQLTVTNEWGVTSDPCVVEVEALPSVCEEPDAPFDATCERQPLPSDLNYVTQCHWGAPPAGDPRPDSVQVMSSPMVVDFDLDGNPSSRQPSIVFTTFTGTNYGRDGVVRVIDGATCTHQFTVPTPTIIGAASPALGDIDLDGRAEVIAASSGGGLVAFDYDPSTGAFEHLWSSGICGVTRAPDFTGGDNRWVGPSIHDLDDDGVPEIVYGATVYDAQGCILSDRLGFPTNSNVGHIAVVVDVDDDGIMELVQGNRLLEWNALLGDWVDKAGFNRPSGGAGRVAVADILDVPIPSLGGRDVAEIVVVDDGDLRVQSVTGAVVFGPYDIPGGGGGPPTAADFDGDGVVEVGVAGRAAYAIFDVDCQAGGDPGRCDGQVRTDGILWSQASQDFSSSQTGSSVFDFNGDGAAEVVYGDECYLRMYDGASGTVLLSAARSSGTTLENPVIADVDGDLAAEIVTSVNDYNDRGCAAVDPLYPSATFSADHGVTVLTHPDDRWVVTRPVWNQHAYSVTNVGDMGEIPATSQVEANWLDPDLNNFRQNSPGSLPVLGIADLSVGCSAPTPVDCDGAVMHVPVEVCNHGSLPALPGAQVSVRDGAVDGPEVCRVTTIAPLDPGVCSNLMCSGVASGPELHLVADPDQVREECVEDNNEGLLMGVYCR